MNPARTITRQILVAIWAKKGTAFLVLGCVLAAKIATLSVPFAFKAIIDGAIAGSSERLLYVFIFIYSLLSIIAVTFNEAKDYWSTKLSNLIALETTTAIFERTLNLPAKWIQDKKAGAFTKQFELGINGINSLNALLVQNILPTILELGAIAGYFLYATSTSIATTFVVSLITYFLLTSFLTRKWSSRRRALNLSETEFASGVLETLSSIEVVKTYTNQALEKDRYARNYQSVCKHKLKAQGSYTLLSIVQQVVIATGMAIVLAITAHQVVNNLISVGELVLINALMLQTYSPLSYIGASFKEFHKSLVDIEKLNEILVQPTEEPNPDNKRSDANISNSISIEFDNVSYNHIEHKTTLSKLSFFINANEKTALVGKSGSGKSTIAKLILGLQNADSGSILINGVSLHQTSLEEHRKRIRLIPQDPTLFNESIEYNIRYGNPNASQEELFGAIRSAQLTELIDSLPEGLRTQIGDRGTKLSGGEKQRISIARALISNPKMLILDEATSALDTEAEAKIQSCLDAISRDKTILIITHKLTTIMNADRILFLSEGSVSESGSHEDLMSQNGAYFNLWHQIALDNQAR